MKSSRVPARGNGLKEICKELNDRGITNKGKRWQKGTSFTTC